MDSIITDKDMFDAFFRLQRILNKHEMHDMVIGKYIVTRFRGKHDNTLLAEVHMEKCCNGRACMVNIHYCNDDCVSVDESNAKGNANIFPASNPWNLTFPTVNFPYNDVEPDASVSSRLRDYCSECKTSFVQTSKACCVYGDEAVAKAMHACELLTKMGMSTIGSVYLDFYTKVIEISYELTFDCGKDAVTNHILNVRALSIMMDDVSCSLKRLGGRNTILGDDLDKLIMQDVCECRKNGVSNELSSIREF